MIVTESILFIATLILSLLISLLIGILLIRKHIYDNMKTILSVCFFIFIGAYFASDWLLRLPLKTIEVIESSSSNTYTHKTNLVYGNNIVRTTNGQELSIKDLGMRAGKIYAINISNNDMLFYPTPYYSSEGIFLFNRNKKPQLPESFLLRTDEFIELESEPDFWFIKAPRNIQIDRGFLGQLWDSMFNVNYVKWSVVPYDGATTN